MTYLNTRPPSRSTVPDPYVADAFCHVRDWRGRVIEWREPSFHFFNQTPLSPRQRRIVAYVGSRLPADTELPDRLMVLTAWMRPNDASDTRVREIAVEVLDWLNEADAKKRRRRR